MPSGSDSEAGTVSESLSEIREILRGLNVRGREDAPPGEGFEASPRNAPTVDKPRKIGPACSMPEALYKQSIAALGISLDGAVAHFDPAPAASKAALPSPRGGGAVVMLTVAGLVVLGAAGLVATQGPKLLHRASSVVEQSRSRAPNGPMANGPKADGPKAVTYAALRPARILPVVKSDAASLPIAMSKEPVAISSRAPVRAPEPRNVGTASGRPSPAAQAATAPPVTSAPGAAAHAQGRGRVLQAAARSAAPARRSHQLRRHRDRHRRRPATRHSRRHRRSAR
jgi:hypothetical protein